MNEEYPKCRICGVELGEAYSLKRVHEEPLHLCLGCFELISAVAHDSARSVFDDIAKIMSGPVKPAVAWKTKLELVDIEERETK